MKTVFLSTLFVLIAVRILAALACDILRDPRGFHRDVTARDNEFPEQERNQKP